MKGPLWAGVFLADPFCFRPGFGTNDFGAGVVGIFLVLFAGGQYSNDSRITEDLGESGLSRPKKIRIIIDWIFFGHLKLKILYIIFFVYFYCVVGT